MRDRWVHRAAVASAVFLGLTSSGSRSSAQRVIPDASSCSRCAIRVQTFATLGSNDGPGFLSSSPESVVVDRQARFWLFSQARAPLVFRSNGEFETELGRLGDGPEEFRNAVHAFPVPGDSVVVLDNRHLRATVVTPDLRIARTAALGGNYRRASPLAWPDSVLLAGLVHTADNVLRPLELASLHGDRSVRRVEFDDPLRSRPEVAVSEKWIISEGGSDQPLVAAARKYAIFRLHDGRELQPLFERRPEWFGGESRHWIGNPTTPPPPTLRAFELASDGRLWVYINVAAATWRQAWPDMPTGVREMEASAIKEDKLFATMVEVIDLSTWRVITSTKLDGMAISALPGERVAVYEVGSDGVPRVRVHQLTLTGG